MSCWLSPAAHRAQASRAACREQPVQPALMPLRAVAGRLVLWVAIRTEVGHCLHRVASSCSQPTHHWHLHHWHLHHQGDPSAGSPAPSSGPPPSVASECHNAACTCSPLLSAARTRLITARPDAPAQPSAGRPAPAEPSSARCTSALASCPASSSADLIARGSASFAAQLALAGSPAGISPAGPGHLFPGAAARQACACRLPFGELWHRDPEAKRTPTVALHWETVEALHSQQTFLARPGLALLPSS
mmetsp:Transcript_22441/g.40035  ORF Transcript_22441/g.40035 Transcript_22441/m.40035 type:complete len:247 (-) Transcript_22441:3-743(-)